MSKRTLTSLFLLLFGLHACFAGEFSVMTYNLERYTLDDRDGDGRKDDPKPENECRAIARLIAKSNPDVLAIQEIGDQAQLDIFAARLKTEGLKYPHTEFLQRSDHDINLAVFSRFPILGSTHHTNEWYSIGKARLTVGRGFLETVIQVDDGYRFHLVNAHLKSKLYSSLGQTEMRRNEARLLNKVVRGIMKDDPESKVLVVGDMNDTPNSAAIREVLGKSKKNLFDLRPAEPQGDAWTHHWAVADVYSRLDYMFANAAMLDDVVREKSQVVRDPLTYAASDHRPVVAVFDTRN